MAILVALLTALLLTVLGAALVLNTSAETMIASNYREAQEGAYAADAAFERTLAELEGAGGWDPLLTGAVRSAFMDGSPGGQRILSDGSVVDLTAIVNLANCARVTPCSSAEMDRVTAERPWGANNPRWQPYAWGRLAGSPYYLVVLVGDDGAEDDADPLADGLGTAPGAGVLEVRAQSLGPHGSHHRIDATLGRDVAGRVRVLSWREIR